MMNQCVKLLSLAFWVFQTAHAASMPGVEEYLTASKTFEQQKVQANARHTMPRLTDARVADARVAAVLKILSDDRVLTGRRYTVQDLGILLDVCAKANEVNMSYVLFDLKNQLTEKNGVAAATLQIQKLMLKNSYLFQDELAKMQPFLIRCMATQLPLTTQFLESLRPEELTDIRRKGALQVRSGTLALYYGLLTSVSDEHIKEANRLRTLAALADTASEFAKSLPVDLKKAIADRANSAIQDAPDALRKHLLTIQRSMSEPDCAALCKL
jgi:hypothetical protein